MGFASFRVAARALPASRGFAGTRRRAGAEIDAAHITYQIPSPLESEPPDRDSQDGQDGERGENGEEKAAGRMGFRLKRLQPVFGVVSPRAQVTAGLAGFFDGLVVLFAHSSDSLKSDNISPAPAI